MIGLSPLTRTQGVSRNLTNQFKQFRSHKNVTSKLSIPNLLNSGDTGKQNLLTYTETPSDFIRHTVPPEWVDRYDDITEQFNQLKDLSNFQSVTKLESLHKQRIAITFGDTKLKDKDISDLSRQVVSIIREIENSIKQIKILQGCKDDSAIRKNISQSLATRLQNFTQKFRNLQQTYLLSLKKVSEPDDFLALSTPESTADFNEDFEVDAFEVSSERTEAIDELVHSISDLAEIFKELSSLVLHQGTILDRIDYNIEQTVEHTTKANQELVIADKRQRCTRATSCILINILMIFILLIALVIKHIRFF